MPSSLRTLLANINKSYETSPFLSIQAAPGLLAVGRFKNFTIDAKPGPILHYGGGVNFPSSPFEVPQTTQPMSGTDTTSAFPGVPGNDLVPAYYWHIRGPQQDMMDVRFQGRTVVGGLGPGQLPICKTFNWALTLKGGPLIMYAFLTFQRNPEGYFTRPWPLQAWEIPPFGYPFPLMILGPLSNNCFVDSGAAILLNDDFGPHLEYYYQAIDKNDFSYHEKYDEDDLPPY